ncbi:hypothetical protein ACPZ19_39040 [Amycolatopsis lurida]
MAKIVGVHGVGNEFRGASILHATWFPALRDGLAHTNRPIEPHDLHCAFYGDLFRPPERVLAGGVPWYTADDLTEDDERTLLMLWWAQAAATDPAVLPAEARTLARTPRGAQAALRALSGSRFFAGVAERGMVFSLKQVRRYFTEEAVRDRIRQRIESAIGPDTRVLIGHSLGSVVAYEALCAHPEWPVRALVTLGSPLGIRNLVFDRLRPPPSNDGMGVWPGSVRNWTNICDEGDVVALHKDLRGLFGEDVRCIQVHCGARAHDASRYLTTRAVGQAVTAGLGDV